MNEIIRWCLNNALYIFIIILEIGFMILFVIWLLSLDPGENMSNMTEGGIFWYPMRI